MHAFNSVRMNTGVYNNVVYECLQPHIIYRIVWLSVKDFNWANWWIRKASSNWIPVNLDGGITYKSFIEIVPLKLWGSTWRGHK